MRSRQPLLALTSVLTLILLVAPALAQAQTDERPGGFDVPEGASGATLGDVRSAVWIVGPDGEPTLSLAPGDSATLHLLVENRGNETRDVRSAVSTNMDLTPGQQAPQGNLSAGAHVLRDWSFTAPEEVLGTIVIGFTVTLETYRYEPAAPANGTDENGNATVDDEGNLTAVLDSTTSFTHTVSVVAPAPPPEGPNLPLIGGAAAVLVLAAGGAYAISRRRRPKPVPRSATLQRMELERRAERARSDTERQKVRQVIQETEAQKAAARDVQILEAKRQDAEKMLGLLKKRFEAGQITKLQYERMVEKKRADLSKIEQDLAEVRDR